MRSFAASLLRDSRGLSLVEFALVLPLLVTLYLGTYEVSDAVACSRKVAVTTKTVADLTSQYENVSSTTLSTILGSATQVIYPFDVSKATLIVSEIYTDANGKTTVVWSQAQNATAHTAGATFVAPATVLTKGGYLIVSEVGYAYTPAISFGVIGPIALGDTIYMSPRLSTSVTLS